MSKHYLLILASIILVSCDSQNTRSRNNNVPQPQEQVQLQEHNVLRQPAQKQVQELTDPNQLIAIKRKELSKLYKELAEINNIKALNKMTRNQNPWINEAYSDMPVHPLDSQNELFDYMTVEIQGKINVIQAEIYGLQQIIMNQPQP